jgi:hypothetical protein
LKEKIALLKEKTGKRAEELARTEGNLTEWIHKAGFQDEAGPIPLSADATVQFFARDLAGNMEESIRSATYRIAQPGDVNLSDTVDIADAILAAQVLAGMTPAGTVYREADVNGDGMIGLAEVLYILQKAAGLR